MSTADNSTGDITGTPGSLPGEEELGSGRAAMTESPLFTRDPDHAEFKTELQEMRERLDQLSDNLAALRAEVGDLAAEIRRSTSS
jgi:septal ring factor EnvC (AmiA/AmiB activator)